MPVNLHQSFLPPSLCGVVAVSSCCAPRFWATIWSDVLKTSLKPSTRRQHLSALERLYDATQRQRGSNCLDRLIAEADVDALEDILVGFLAQLRNEAAMRFTSMSSPAWRAACSTRSMLPAGFMMIPV